MKELTELSVVELFTGRKAPRPQWLLATDRLWEVSDFVAPARS